MKYKVTVYLKENVLDPQGTAILQTLHNIGYKSIEDIRVGKVFFVEINGDNSKNIIENISKNVFSNPVIEKFEIEVLGE